MSVSAKTRYTVFIIAGVILILCVVWTFTRGRNTERARICDFLASYGYEATEEDLLFAYDEKNTTIREAIDLSDEELAPAVAASKEAGFNSDIDKKGGVTLILARFDTDTVYMYMSDGDFELVFVQSDNGSVSKIG